MLPRPDVGAVSADDERKVAKNADATCVVPSPLPLVIRNPWEPRSVQNLTRQTTTRTLDGRLLPHPKPFVPLEPVSALVFLMKRAKEGVVVEPPPFAVHELAKLGRSRGLGLPLGAFEAVERQPKRARFDVANDLICDELRAARLFQSRAIGLRQRALTPCRREFFHFHQR